MSRSLTNDYRMSREKLLKSEALLTLSLKVNFEANSAPTLHRRSTLRRTLFGVGALFAEPLVAMDAVKWHLSRPNCALHRARWLRDPMGIRKPIAAPSFDASAGAPVSLIR